MAKRFDFYKKIPPKKRKNQMVFYRTEFSIVIQILSVWKIKELFTKSDLYPDHCSGNR